MCGGACGTYESVILRGVVPHVLRHEARAGVRAGDGTFCSEEPTQLSVSVAESTPCKKRGVPLVTLGPLGPCRRYLGAVQTGEAGTPQTNVVAPSTHLSSGPGCCI